MDAAHRWMARACIPEQVKAEIGIVDRRSGQLLHCCWTEMTAEMFAQEAVLFLGTAVQARAASQAVLFVFGHAGRPRRGRIASSLAMVVMTALSVLPFIGCCVQLMAVLTWALVMQKSTGPLQISAGDGFQVRLYDGQVSITTNQRQQQNDVAWQNDTDADLPADSKNASAVIDDLLSEVVHNSMNDMLSKLSESLKTIIDKFQPKVESASELGDKAAPLNMTRYNGQKVEESETEDRRLVDGLFSLLNMINSRAPTTKSLQLGTVTPATSTVKPTTASSRPATVVEVPMQLILQQIKFNSSTSTVAPTAGGEHRQLDNQKKDHKPMLIAQTDFVPSSHQFSKKSKSNNNKYLVEIVLIAVGAVFGILTIVSIGMIVATFCQLKKPRHRSWAPPVHPESSKAFLEPEKTNQIAPGEALASSSCPGVDSFDRDVDTIIAFSGLTASLDDSARHSNLYSRIRI
ncbi:hypothetical protein T4D_16891 [Trichinella pseudospiralis]|uniref:Uncharacterized protein n=1 Tax=Trichinella pseudospiralis TaxID=6337 RepID=A0A0V1F864_TRIPS|nr:hypothetical protein T4D_16891 [Trichinella pseudospiralis]